MPRKNHTRTNSRVEEIASSLFDGKDVQSVLQSVSLNHMPGTVQSRDLLFVYGIVVKTLVHTYYLTPRELAKVSGIGEKQIRVMMKNGKLKYWRAPGAKHIQTTLLDLINAMEPGAS